MFDTIKNIFNKKDPIQASIDAPFYPAPGSTIDSILTAFNDGIAYPLYGEGFPTRYLHRDLATSYSAVYRCATLIAATLAGMPLRIKDKSTKQIVEPSDTPAGMVADLLDRGPDPNMPMRSTVENIALDLLLDGNFYLIKKMDNMGNVTELSLANPWGAEIYTHNNRRSYALVDEEADRYLLDAGDVIHGLMPRVWRRSQGYQTQSSGRFKGVAPVQAVRPALEIGLASDGFINRFYNGKAIHSQMVLSPRQPFQNTEQKDIAVSLLQRFMRNRTQEPLIFPNSDVTQLQSTSQSRELTPLREFQVGEIARAYGVPPPLIGINTTQWGSGISELSELFLTYCLVGFMDRIEAIMGWRLLPRGYFMEFDSAKLRRASPAVMADMIAKLIGGTQSSGVISINTARDWLGLPPVKNGDSIYTFDPSAGAENNP